MRKDLMRKDFTRRETMRKAGVRQEKKGSSRLIYGLVIFLTLGIGLSNEILTRLSIEGSYIWLFSVALLIAGFMVEGNKMMLLTIVIGVVAINLPEATLAYYGIDSDFVLASVCAIIMLPAIYSALLQ